MIAYQAVMNMSVVTGCMPTKGISLPFISYGGSNLLLLYSLVGIIFNCMRYNKPMLGDISVQ
jgi:cell division protein FtsW